MQQKPQPLLPKDLTVCSLPPEPSDFVSCRDTPPTSHVPFSKHSIFSSDLPVHPDHLSEPLVPAQTICFCLMSGPCRNMIDNACSSPEVQFRDFAKKVRMILPSRAPDKPLDHYRGMALCVLAALLPTETCLKQIGMLCTVIFFLSWRIRDCLLHLCLSCCGLFQTLN
jgi:hypothetical protein